MATGWWALSTDGVEELFETDLEHIAEMIKQGFTSGELVQDGEETDTERHNECPECGIDPDNREDHKCDCGRDTDCTECGRVRITADEYWEGSSLCYECGSNK